MIKSLPFCPPVMLLVVHIVDGICYCGCIPIVLSRFQSQKRTASLVCDPTHTDAAGWQAKQQGSEVQMLPFELPFHHYSVRSIFQAPQEGKERDRAGRANVSHAPIG